MGGKPRFEKEEPKIPSKVDIIRIPSCSFGVFDSIAAPIGWNVESLRTWRVNLSSKNKFKLDLFQPLRIIRISQLGTMSVLTAQLKPDFRPSKCLEFVSKSRHTKALDVLRIQKRRGNQNSDWTEFWWEFMKNSPDSKIVEKLSQKTFWFSQKKKVMVWPSSKHGGYFVPIPWRALCGQEIFSMRIEVFSIQIELFFRPP